jgi:uncharacterized membrane protein YccC
MQSDPAPIDDAAASAPGNQPRQEPAGASVRQRLAELREYFSYYTAARLDSLKSSVRRLVLWAVVLLIGLLAVAGFVITAVVLICNGICDALTRLLHSRSLGEFLTGILLLLGLFAAAYFGLGAMRQFWHSQAVAKYEARRQRQREHFGHDVSEAANAHEPQPRK